MNENLEPKRYNWIDITKGIVMVLTVYMHGRLNSVPYIGDWVNAFFMPLFFFISGFLLKPDKYNSKEFVYRRWLTLYRPWFIFSLILTIFTTPLNGGKLVVLENHGWGGTLYGSYLYLR